jgi:hypothetical protein
MYTGCSCLVCPSQTEVQVLTDHSAKASVLDHVPSLQTLAEAGMVMVKTGMLVVEGSCMHYKECQLETKERNSKWRSCCSLLIHAFMSSPC